MGNYIHRWNGYINKYNKTWKIIRENEKGEGGWGL